MQRSGARWIGGVALGAVLAASFVVGAAAGPAAAADVSGNPLAGAGGFTVVSLGGLELSNHEIEGSVAAAGTIVTKSVYGPYNLIHKAAGNGAYVLPTLGGVPVRLVAGGTFDVTGSTQRTQVASGGYTDAATQLGRAVLGSDGGYSIAGRGAGVCVQAAGHTDCGGNVLEQSAASQTVAWTVQPTAFDTLVPAAGRSATTAWSDAIATGRLVGTTAVHLPSDLSNPMNGVQVDLTAGTVNVLDIASSDLPGADWKLKFGTVKPTATSPLVINVTVPDGGGLNLPLETIDQYAGGSGNAFAPYVLWNVVQADGQSAYLYGNGIVPGSVLAPHSTLYTGFSGASDTSADKTLIEGQVFAAEVHLRNSGEIHHYGFAATLTYAEASAPTATGTFTLTTQVGDDDDVLTGTESFTSQYSTDGGSTWTNVVLGAGGSSAAVSVPAGTVVWVRAVAPAAVAGATWADPVWTADATLTAQTGGASSFVVGDHDALTATVTHVITADPVVPAPGGFTVDVVVVNTSGVTPDVSSFGGTWASSAVGSGGTTSGTWGPLGDGGSSSQTGFPAGTTASVTATAPTGETKGTWAVSVTGGSVTVTAGGDATVTATYTFTPAPPVATGSFSLATAVSDDDGVLTGTESFTSQYSIDGGSTWTNVVLGAGGSSAAVSVPAGTEVWVRTVAPAAVAGATWADPTWTADTTLTDRTGGAHSFVVGAGETPTATVTHVITADPVVPAPGGFTVDVVVVNTSGVTPDVSSFAGAWSSSAAGSAGTTSGTWGPLGDGGSSSQTGFPAGTTVSVTATAPTGETAGTWSVSVTGGSATITAGGTATVTATYTFTPKAPAPTPPSVSLGSWVWLDENGDGVRDPGEAGIAGVVLTLTGPGGAVLDVDGVAVGPVTTAADGSYVFARLPLLAEGQAYTVTIDRVASAAALHGLEPTRSGAGSHTWVARSGALVDDGAADTTLDFGFVLAAEDTGSGALATTGANTLVGAAWALVLLVVGGGLVLLARRRSAEV
jgi:hypothetical protein